MAKTDQTQSLSKEYGVLTHRVCGNPILRKGEGWVTRQFLFSLEMVWHFLEGSRRRNRALCRRSVVRHGPARADYAVSVRSKRCALNVVERHRRRKCRQIMCAHLRRSFEAGSQLDQLRLAERTPEEADPEWHAEHHSR